MITVTKTYLPPFDEYAGYLKKIWQSGQITNNGPFIRQLSDDLKKYLGVSNLEIVANGTLALQLAIKALGLKGEIITTPYSYVATTLAILWEGCEPVFVDIEDKTFCIDPNKIESAITERTCAILATHVYGYPCNIENIEKIAQKYNLKIIYDTAHAFGVKYQGKSIASYGDISALSFHATKLFHTAEGGALVCKNETLARKIDIMKKFGHIGEEEYLQIGINAKMSELHAAMGITVLPMVDKIIDYGKMCFKHYDELLVNLPIKRPEIPAGFIYNFAYYPVVFYTHEIMMLVRRQLLTNGIVPRRYFYPSLNTLSYLRPEWQRPCPVSEDTASKVLCLPIYFGIEDREIEQICKCISNLLQ